MNEYNKVIQEYKRSQWLNTCKVPALYLITFAGVQHFSGHFCIAFAAIAAVMLVRK